MPLARLIVDAQAFRHSRTEVVQQDVRLRYELVNELPAFQGLEVHLMHSLPA